MFPSKLYECKLWNVNFFWCVLGEDLQTVLPQNGLYLVGFLSTGCCHAIGCWLCGPATLPAPDVGLQHFCYWYYSLSCFSCLVVAQASKSGPAECSIKYQYMFTRARKYSIQSCMRECQRHSVHFHLAWKTGRRMPKKRKPVWENLTRCDRFALCVLPLWDVTL